jgi:trans-aconitate 2-methyltransferase
MPRWDSAQYLKFEAERTRPTRDLVARLELDRPQRIIDLGCGPGTSTAVLRQRWPSAEVVGLDSSPEMLEVARRGEAGVRWVEGDLRSWQPDVPFDLVFSNAALQWLPGHERELPRLLSWVRPGGAFAFQVPARDDPAPQWIQALDAVGRLPAWAGRDGPPESGSNVLELSAYYDLLAPGSARVDLWDTIYDHVLDGPRAVVAWVEGAGLRPWLERLRDDDERAAFLKDYTREIERRFPRHRDGRVLLPFLRRFAIAYR